MEPKARNIQLILFPKLKKTVEKILFLQETVHFLLKAPYNGISTVKGENLENK